MRMGVSYEQSAVISLGYVVWDPGTSRPWSQAMLFALAPISAIEASEPWRMLWLFRDLSPKKKSIWKMLFLRRNSSAEISN